MADDAPEEDFIPDYEETSDNEAAGEDGTQTVEPASKKDVKGTYVSIHSSGFRDFLLKPELLRAIVDCGFEHPSEGKIFIVLVKLLLNHIAIILKNFVP